MSVDWTDCSDTEVILGKVPGVPLLKHSRVPADTVVESAELGETPAEIAFNYGLKVVDVRRVLAYAAKHRAVPAP
jgi:uncharacterized protein (DUF433 family)